MTKRSRSAITVCSTAFVTLGRAQAKALGAPGLPLAVVPHPFGSRKRDEIRDIAVRCAEDIAQLVTGSAAK